MSRIVATFDETLLFGGGGDRWLTCNRPLTVLFGFWLSLTNLLTHRFLKKRKWQIWLISIGSTRLQFFCLFVFKTNNISYALLFFLVSIASLTCLITCGTEDDHETKMFCYSCAAGSTEVTLTKLSPLQKTLHFLNFKHARWEMNVIMIRFLPYFTLPSVQLCPTLCDPMNCNMPGLPVRHQLPEFTQTHVHGVGDAIHPSHPRSSPSPSAANPSQHQGLFQWVNC